MLTLRKITKRFAAKAGEVTALDGINLSIEASEIFGIIGSSGAGKSTLVRLFNLLERPTSGDVIVDDEVITHLEGAALRATRRKIGMIFQQFNLLSARTVAGNVAYPLELTGLYGKAEIDRRVKALLERVGLADQAEKYPRQLSGGQKQRVGIARALASEPKVLLCDEPTSALDPQTTGAVLRLLQDINRDLGVTIVIITHEMDVVRRACDRVAVIDRGRIVEQGRVDAVFLHPKHEATLRLVREAEPDADALDVLADGDRAGRIIRVTSTGDKGRQPIPAAVSREFGVDFDLLAGRVGHIRDLPYAQFTVSLTGRDVDGAIRALRERGISVDVFGADAEAQKTDAPVANEREALRDAV